MHIFCHVKFITSLCFFCEKRRIQCLKSLTCSLARTISRGLVSIVVVNPPSVPATHWMNKWDIQWGLIFRSSSVKKNYKFPIIWNEFRVWSAHTCHVRDAEEQNILLFQKKKKYIFFYIKQIKSINYSQLIPNETFNQNYLF